MVEKLKTNQYWVKVGYKTGEWPQASVDPLIDWPWQAEIVFNF